MSPAEQTTKQRKRKRHNQQENDLLSGLPIECSVTEFDGDPTCAEVTLHQGWSPWAESREALVEEALAYADPEGQDSQSSEYNEDTARRMLFRRGWIDAEHFVGENRNRPLAEEIPEGIGEIGWNIRIQFVRVNLERAIQLVDNMAARLSENYTGPDTPSPTASSIPTNVAALRRRVHLLLNSHAAPSSIHYAMCHYKYRHSDYPSGGVQDSLAWLTSDNRRVEVTGWYSYEIT